jgi:hypothetical protein
MELEKPATTAATPSDLPPRVTSTDRSTGHYLLTLEIPPTTEKRSHAADTSSPEKRAKTSQPLQFLVVII